MLLKPFRIHEAESVDQAVGLLAELGEYATLYAGGTELLLSMKQGLLHYDHLIDIKRIPELRVIAWDEAEHVVRIGAAVTHAELEESSVVAERVPILRDLEKKVANVRVRNAGTIGGNLCFADPHSDPGTLMVALGASFHLAGLHGRRVISAEDFYLGAYETVRDPGEIMTQIDVPVPGGAAKAVYLKFQHLERPSVGTAVILWEGTDGLVERARVAIGCVGPRAIRLPECEELLVGKSVTELCESAALVAAERAAHAVTPVADLGGSVEYKRHLSRVLVQRAVIEAARQFRAAEGRHLNGDTK